MTVKIAWLKARARAARKRYLDELNSMSCGAALGEIVNPRLAEAKRLFNKTLDQLAAVDPTCPKDRL